MEAKIVTYADRFGGRTLHEHALRNPSSVGDRTLPAPGVALGVDVPAFVNGGRWIALCPTCSGCELINPDEPLLFCCECRNAAVDHQPIVVTVPSARQRAQVEAYLLARPAPATRNWRHTETVTFLRAENREQGWRLPKAGA